MYNVYTSLLYQLKRLNSRTIDVTPLSAGGVANASVQDAFCAGTGCLISIIYGQSGYGNHLSPAPPGGAAKGPAANS